MTSGYTLAPTTTTLVPGTTAPFTFRILGADGAPVTAYDVEHEKRLHLIVARRDTAGFQHVHPELGDDGIWSVPLTIADAGVYRVFADFKPHGGEGITLGVDLFAGGDFRPVEYRTSRVAEVDGYQVRLDGELMPGMPSKVTRTVAKDGRAVTDLQSYLDAYGHLVALRGGARGDLLRRVPDGGHLPAVPRFPARGQGPHRRLHRHRLTTGPGLDQYEHMFMNVCS